MRCGQCGADNPDGKRFCGDCGTALAQRCGSCGAENPAAKKYCGDCGAGLGGGEAVAGRGADRGASASRSEGIRPKSSEVIRVAPERVDPAALGEGERKTVTALFADIKGSMELMEDLDPEEAQAIIDPALTLMIDAVHRYDGYIVQSTGDGIFALFGAPLAHEDHPQRALYAALRMQEEIKKFAGRLRAEKGLNLQVRVGANAGEVVVRTIQTGESHAEYTPIGHSTSLASRLQTLASPGSIAISEAVRKLVEGYFTLKALGPARIKGASEPVNVYEVTGLGPLRTRLQRAVGRGLTKFVGRERELAALKDAAERARSGRGQIVAAVAEAGVGKSRLFHEFKATSQSGWMVLETFSTSYGKASAYLPVIDLLRNYFDIASSDDERKRREKVAGKIAILDRTLEDTLPYLYGLLGIADGGEVARTMDTRTRKQRTLEAIRRIILRESLNQPLIIVFEDLHWVDLESEALLDLIADSIDAARILLLVNYRPEYTNRWRDKSCCVELRLEPLAQESAGQMLDALVGVGPELQPLRRLILERTEGNPFFMEETVQAMLEEGTLARNGEVRLAKPLSELKIPATVQAILAARIDRLPAHEKELLQTLAVIGKEFTQGLVERVWREVHPQGEGRAELERMIEHLQLAELIYEQAAAGEIEYTFKHALTQEVAYGSILSERRKLLHERAAEAIEEMDGGSGDRLHELAHHYSRSANSAKAVHYLGAAAQQATRRSAYADAMALATAGLELIGALPAGGARERQEIELQMTLGQCGFVVDGWGSRKAGAAYHRAWELCQGMGETSLAAGALLGLQQFYLGRGELRKARELDEEVLALAKSAGDEGLLYEATYLAGLTLFHTGEFGAARENHEWVAAVTGRREVSAALSEHPSVGCLAYLSSELWYLGYPDKAVAAIEEALRRAREEAHPFSLAFAMMFAVVLRILRREADAAVEMAQALIAMAIENAIAAFAIYGRMYLGWALSMRGEVQEGIATMREAVESWRVANSAIAVPSGLIAAAEARARIGKTNEALALVDDALEVIGRNGEFSSEADAYRVKGELLLATAGADALAAEQCLRKALEISRAQQAKSLELRAAMSLARSLVKRGRRAEARELIAPVYAWFTEGFETADLKEAKALIEEQGENDA